MEAQFKGDTKACEGWDDSNPARNGIYTVRASDGGGLTRVTTSPGGGHDVAGDYSGDDRGRFRLHGSELDRGDRHRLIWLDDVNERAGRAAARTVSVR